MNLRAPGYFLVLRSNTWGREMRVLAVKILKAVGKVTTSLLFDFQVAGFLNGSPMVRRVARGAQEAK